MTPARCGGARWLDAARVWRPGDPDALVTGDVETAVVLLAGTFDLSAGGNAWPARGARGSPFAGRPMAVFLPPRTELRVANVSVQGQGPAEILLVSARQPAAAPEPTGREALSRKPLLPLAGSGKAFDPATGEWRPAETFATSPESLPPRRFERLDASGIPVERVFAPDYKAATLSLDELVVPAGGSLSVADVPKLPACDEVLLFVRPEATARIGGDDIHGDTVRWLPFAEARALRIDAVGGRAYVVIAYAGKSPAGT